MFHNKPSRLMILVLALMIAACSRLQGVDDNNAIVEPTTAINTPEPVPSQPSTPVPTPLPSPSPTIPTAQIEVTDQVVSEDGRITIARVNSPEKGWLVIYVDDGGETAAALGHSPVEAGQNENVVVTIDPLEASPQLIAMLHIDGGEPEVFEHPGPDDPVQIDSELVTASFSVDIQAVIPSISVSDQDLGEEGQVIVDEVIATQPGWISVFADETGEIGSMLAYAPVTEGRNENIELLVNWRQATPDLHVVLYDDAGEANVFERDQADQVAVVNGDPIATTFRATYPPDVFVLNQPVTNGVVAVERAVSYGPGWVVVYNDDEGQLGNIIGWAAIEDGLNMNIDVPVTESAVTPILYIMLHLDLETVGEFGFPRTDPLVRYQDRIPNPFTIQTDTGNYIISSDQILSPDSTLTIPLVVVDVGAWIVVYNDVDGQPGDILGFQHVPAGVTRNINIKVDPESTTSSLFAVLHVDAGEPDDFDPEGLDIPMQRNRNIIQSPFQILSDDDSEQP